MYGTRQVNMRRTEKAAALSTVAYAILGGGMVVVALISRSVSLLAEGIHTLADSVTSVAVWIGLRLSERHSKTFPFGLYKLENLIAAAIGLLIIFGAYELASESIRQLMQEPEPLEKPGLVLAVMAVSMLLMGLTAWYENKVAREENSPGLSADARHSIADLGAAAAVFVGVGLETAGVPRADSVAALVVVAFLAFAGIEVMLSGVKVLLDASIDKDILFKVKEIAESHHGVKDVIGVEGRNSGSYRFLSIALVPRTVDLDKADHVAKEVRDSIVRGIPNVDRVNIELRTEEKGSMLCAVPLDVDASTASAHFGEVHSFAIIDIRLPEGEVISRENLINPFAELTRGKGVKVAEFLAQQGVELVLVREELEGKGAHYTLDARGILELVRPEAVTLEDAERALVEFIRGRVSKS